MKIGELAAEAQVPAKTIRYWESAGLVPDPARTASGYRDYRPDAVSRLAFIRQAQTAGLTLDQIRQVLDIGDEGTPPCEHVTKVVDERLAEIERRIAELDATRSHLLRLAARAAAQDPADCEGYCSIISPSG